MGRGMESTMRDMKMPLEDPQTPGRNEGGDQRGRQEEETRIRSFC